MNFEIPSNIQFENDNQSIREGTETEIQKANEILAMYKGTGYEDDIRGKYEEIEAKFNSEIINDNIITGEELRRFREMVLSSLEYNKLENRIASIEVAYRLLIDTGVDLFELGLSDYIKDGKPDIEKIKIDVEDGKISLEDLLVKERLIRQIIIDKNASEIEIIDINKDDNLNKGFESIFSSDLSGYEIGVNLFVFIEKINGIDNESQRFDIAFEKLNNFLLANPELNQKFIELWGTGNFGENNIRSGLKRCEIDKYLPELKIQAFETELEGKREQFKQNLIDRYSSYDTEGKTPLGEKLDKNLREYFDKGDACTVSLISIITKFETENGIDPKITSTELQLMINQSLVLEKQSKSINFQKGLLEYPELSKQLEGKTLEEQKYIIEASGLSEEEKINLLEKLSSRENIQKAINNNRTLTLEDYEKLIKEIEKNPNKDPREIMKNLQREKSINHLETISFPDRTPEAFYEASEQGYDIRFENNNYTITDVSGKKIELTRNEAKEISSPETIKSLINIKETFKKIGLDLIWDNRQDIFMSMGDISLQYLNSDGINEGELLKIYNFVGGIVGMNKFDTPEAGYNGFMVFNESNGNNPKENNHGRSNLEQFFWDNKLFTPENGMQISRLQSFAK